MPKHQVHDGRDLDRAAFGEVQHVAAEQAHDVALVAVTPGSEVQVGCNVHEAILLSISRVGGSDETAKLTEEGKFNFLKWKLKPIVNPERRGRNAGQCKKF